MTTIAIGCALLLFSARLSRIVFGANASTTSAPIAGPSWQSDTQLAIQQDSTIFGNEAIRNSFAVYVRDAAAEKLISPKTEHAQTSAFRQLKRVLPPRDACRIKWASPKAKAALIRYRNELEVEKNISPRPMRKSDIIKTYAFKKLKFSVEQLHISSFSDGALYDRVRQRLKEMAEEASFRQNLKLSQRYVYTYVQDDASSSSFSTKNDYNAFAGDVKAGTAEDFSYASIYDIEGASAGEHNFVDSAESVMALIDWSDPLVASAFDAYQSEIDAEVPPSMIFDGAFVTASAAFCKFKTTIEKIYNFTLADSLFYDFVMEHICQIAATDL